MKPTLSVVIPALNEESNIARCIEEVIEVIGDPCAEYEILLFDDGSVDRTGAIMDSLAKANPRLRVIHNASPRNTGGVFKQALSLARYEYLMMVHGDNENPCESLRGPMEAIGLADVVVPYTTNQQVRPLLRRVVSRIYTWLLNRLFGLRLKYYNGTSIYRVKDLKAIDVKSDSFAHLAERLIRLIQRGHSYVEIGVPIASPQGRTSKALRLGNFVQVVATILWLFYDIRLKESAVRS